MPFDCSSSCSLLFYYFSLDLFLSVLALNWLYSAVDDLDFQGENTPIVLQDKISIKLKLISCAFFFRLFLLLKSVASYIVERGDNSIPYITESDDGND